MCPTTRRTTVPAGGRARDPEVARSFDRLDDAACHLAKSGQGAQAGFVVASHDVIQAEAEHCVEDQWHEYVSRNRQPDAAVVLEPGQLLVGHLAIPGEERGE